MQVPPRITIDHCNALLQLLQYNMQYAICNMLCIHLPRFSDLSCHGPEVSSIKYAGCIPDNIQDRWSMIVLNVSFHSILQLKYVWRNPVVFVLSCCRRFWRNLNCSFRGNLTKWRGSSPSSRGRPASGGTGGRTGPTSACTPSSPSTPTASRQDTIEQCPQHTTYFKSYYL